ncbi:MAG: sulfite exporter TauE/SafE family protein [Microthrixaceae bacterium]
MNASDLVGAGLAGLAAGAINVVVGSGTLVTFPSLLALGVPAVAANATSTVGLVFGSISGSVGYRAELSQRWTLVQALVPAVCLGAVGGSLLVLVAPPEVFEAVVPLLILAATAALLTQPALTAWVARRRPPTTPDPTPADEGPSPRLVTGIGAAGIYGGYFGAGLGIVLLAVLGAAHPDDLQGTNAVKNALAVAANSLAAVVFAFSGRVRWDLSAAIAVGALLGGQLGAQLGRRVPDAVLRGVMVAVGLIAAASVAFG